MHHHTLSRTAFSAAAAMASMSSTWAAFTGLSHAFVTTPASAEAGLWTVDLFAEFSQPNDVLLSVQEVDITPSTGVFVDDPSPIGPGWDPLPSAVLASQQNQCLACAESFITIGLATGDGNGVAIDPGWNELCGLDQALTCIPGGAGWYNGNAPNLQGRAGNYGTAAPYKVLIARLTMVSAPGSSLTIGTMLINSNMGLGTPLDQAFSVPHVVNAPAPSSPMIPPTSTITSVRAYRLTGNPTGAGWSWCIAGPNLPSDLWDHCVPGVASGGNVLNVTGAFANSINGVAASLLLPASQMHADSSLIVLPTGALFPLGCPASPANSALLSIRVPDATTTPTWNLYVGPPCGPATCLVNNCTTGCAFNPMMVEIPLSGQDCNANGQDDGLDILTGASVDADADGVPDECAACGAGAGSCFLVHAGPGCSAVACCELVCAFDQFCCDLAWDQACVDLATAFCGVPTACDLADHDCAMQGGPGCTDIGCCGTVCGSDSFCCEVAWDDLCVGEAIEACGLEVMCPPSDHPCTEGGAPGCTNVACCVEVCTQDPFCCQLAWDQLCADAAGFLCSTPGDLNGDGIVNGADLGVMLGAWASPGPTDLDGNGTTDGGDLGILLGNWGAGPS